MSKPEQGKPGVIMGKDRDTRLEAFSVRSMGDERFGKLMRALGQAADDFTRAKAPDIGLLPRRSGDMDDVEWGIIMDARQEAREKHVDLKNQVAQKLQNVIRFANMAPDVLSVAGKEAVFENDTPVLYLEHWGTDDLAEPSRDSVEFQTVVALNGCMERPEGPVLVRSAIERIYDAYTGWGPARMSAHSVPGELATFGTIQPVVFQPIVEQNS